MQEKQNVLLKILREDSVEAEEVLSEHLLKWKKSHMINNLKHKFEKLFDYP